MCASWCLVGSASGTVQSWDPFVTETVENFFRQNLKMDPGGLWLWLSPAGTSSLDVAQAVGRLSF